MKRRLLALVVGCGFAVAAIAPIAGADPINAKNVFDVQVVCGSQTYNVVVNGNGAFSPGHIVGSTSVLVPTAFSLTFTFTPPGGPTMTETETAAKAARVANTITCTIPFQSRSGPEGTFTIEGTVTGFLTPRG